MHPKASSLRCSHQPQGRHIRNVGADQEQELPPSFLIAWPDTAKRVFRHRNFDDERDAPGIVRGSVRAYAHRQSAFASQPTSRRD